MATAARKRKTKERVSRAFRGLLREPDRWPDAPPLSTSLSQEELFYFVDSGLRSGMLSNFEHGIASGVLDSLIEGRRISFYHRKALDQMGVLRACWNSDLDLWSERHLPGEGRKLI